MGIIEKTGAMKKGDWAMEMTLQLVIRAVIVLIIYSIGFLKILPSPAVIKDGPAQKK
jgi:hypothetical protein